MTTSNAGTGPWVRLRATATAPCRRHLDRGV
jgi:hypothetical protein